MTGRWRLAMAASIGGLAVLGGSAGDAISAPTCLGMRVTITGTPGPDVIRAPKHSTNVILARAGDDRILGGSRRDVICGGPGRDRISGGRGSDLIHGGAGRDHITGGRSGDELTGGGGPDMLLGGDGSDRLEGGPGGDRAYGELHDDHLAGGGASDVLAGGPGSDRIEGGRGSDWIRGGTQGDQLDGGPGKDWVSYAAANPGVRAYGMQIRLSSDQPLVREETGNDRGTSIESVLGSAFNDSITGDGSPGTVDGLMGPEFHCEGFARNSCVCWARQVHHDPECEHGNVELYGYEREPIALVEPRPRDPGLIVLGSRDNDRIQVRARSATTLDVDFGPGIVAGPGCIRLNGDTLRCRTPTPVSYVLAYGDQGADHISVEGRFPAHTEVRLAGGPGGDTLTGGPGPEILLAGQARISSGPDHDVLRGGGGNDALLTQERLDLDRGDALFGGPGVDQLTADHPCVPHRMSGGPGGPDVTGFAPWGGGPEHLGIRGRRGGRVRLVSKSVSECPGALVDRSNEALEGSSAGDILLGTSGRDVLIGQAGNDVLRGFGGPDGLLGGRGSDQLFGGAGFDVLRAADQTKDQILDCGPGRGRAFRDRLDPKPRRCRR